MYKWCKCRSHPFRTRSGPEDVPSPGTGDSTVALGVLGALGSLPSCCRLNKPRVLSCFSSRPFTVFVRYVPNCCSNCPVRDLSFEVHTTPPCVPLPDFLLNTGECPVRTSTVSHHKQPTLEHAKLPSCLTQPAQRGGAAFTSRMFQEGLFCMTSLKPCSTLLEE